jgi:hypothetical protein
MSGPERGAIKKLDESQVEAFNTVYVSGQRWVVIKRRIDDSFPEGEFTFLDLGGGNGKFTDALLAQYPLACGTVLDNSQTLLSRNEPNARKSLICDSVENLARIDRAYDLICTHWLLHHLISDSYAQSRRNQLALLSSLPKLMTARGRVSLFENNYSGWIAESFPGYVIYRLTASRALASLTRRLGANTAGVGVCFLSRSQWLRTIDEAGLQVQDYAEPDTWTWPLGWNTRVFLNIKHIRVGHYWLSA